MTSSRLRTGRPLVALLAVVALVGAGLSGCSTSEPESKPEPAGDPAPQVAEPAPPPKPTKETQCDDGADDDGDGKVDCADSDCTPLNVCQIARCKEICATIMACDTIVDACSDKEWKGVLSGCQDGCADDKTRNQVTAADGVPCFVIAGVFLEQVQGNGLCGGEKPAAEDAGA